eukprot:767688-Hanusia_phi.AAC.4
MQTIKEMFLVMYASRGVGLAAPQAIGEMSQGEEAYEGDKKKWLQEIALINPKIVEMSEGTDVENEACLSFPGMQGKVKLENSRGVAHAETLQGSKTQVDQDRSPRPQGQAHQEEGPISLDFFPLLMPNGHSVHRLDSPRFPARVRSPRRLEDEEDRQAVKPKLDELKKLYKDQNGDDGAPQLKWSA